MIGIIAGAIIAIILIVIIVLKMRTRAEGAYKVEEARYLRQLSISSTNLKARTFQEYLFFNGLNVLAFSNRNLFD